MSDVDLFTASFAVDDPYVLGLPSWFLPLWQCHRWNQCQTLVGGMDMKPQEKQALLNYYNKRYGWTSQRRYNTCVG